MSVTLTIHPSNEADNTGISVAKAISDIGGRIYGGDYAVNTSFFNYFGLGFGTYEPSSACLDFMYTGPVFEIISYDNGASFRVYVDDVLVQLAGAPADDPVNNPALTRLGNTGDNPRLRLEFNPPAQNAHVRIEGQGLDIGYFGFGPNDTYSTPSGSSITPKIVIGPRMIVLGDSFTEGIGSVGSLESWATQFGRDLGIYDVWPLGVGGTGYLNTVGGTKPTFRSRFDGDVIPFTPNILVFAGGTNDPCADQAAMTALTNECNTLFAHAKASLPNASIYVMSPWEGPNSHDQPHINASAAVLAAVNATGGIKWIDSSAIFTGTGFAGNLKNDGNSDLYFSSDGAHPNAAGHNYLAKQLSIKTPELNLVNPQPARNYSERSNTTAVTPNYKPNPCTNLVGFAKDHAALLVWVNPINLGSVIVYQRLQVKYGDPVNDWVNVTELFAATAGNALTVPNTYTVSGLTNNVVYEFDLVAVP